MDITFPRIAAWPRFLRLALIGLLTSLVVACGGDDDNSDSAPAGSVPLITQQPGDISVTAGQAASFSVTATGATSYQWQRNDVDIDGATSASYSPAAPTLSDSGVHFRVVVHNALGDTPSREALLTVTPATPVLTITQQPVDTSITAGATATFTVAATCSSGTLDIKWQRNNGASGAFAAIDSETAASLAINASTADNGAQFRATLDCSGQATTTSTAVTLTVAASSGLRLDPLTVTGLGPQGEINRAVAVAVNADGSITFDSDTSVGRIDANLTTITHVAGAGAGSIVDGTTATASFSQLRCAVADSAGNLYLCDNSSVRKIAADGTVTTFVGSASGGNADGTGSAARFGNPSALALGPDGDLYLSDSQGNNIRRITPAGVVTTYAGSPTNQSGYAEGAAGGALFNAPRGIAVASNGDVLVADYGSNRIRRIARSGNGAGNVTTLAGTGSTGPGADAMEHPISLTLRGNTLTVLQEQSLVRQIDLTTGTMTTLTGTYVANPTGAADGGPGHAQFTGQGGIAALADGRFIVADGASIRVISSTGDVRTLAVSGFDDAFAVNGGVLAQEPFIFPSNRKQTLTVDTSGRVVVSNAKEVRRIAPSGAVSLVAGLSNSVLGMVDGNGSAAQFDGLGSGIAAAPDGTLYVSDDSSLRRIDTAGNVSLLAGYRVLLADSSGSPNFGAVDGDAATARFQNSLGLAVGPDGALYVADLYNDAIRRVDASGNTTTWAGAFGQSSRVDGPRATSRFSSPQSLAFAPDGSLYVIDAGSLRKISSDGTTVSTVVNNGSLLGLAIDAGGNIYVSGSTGLFELAHGASSLTPLIAGFANDALVFGTSPHLGRIDAISVLATGQLVLISGGQLVKVTLP